ncbi:MAG: TetR family transcriptional regulator, partial [Polyangiaceae bacterium]
MASRRAPLRRTQQERREGTIRKLLDAAAEALVDVGYSAASVQVICERAGLSQGALFRHFATREALMVAVGQDVGEQTLDRYRREFAALRGHGDPQLLALRLVRARCRSRLNQAWYELAMAARTSPRLRRGLRPIAARYYSDIERLARETLPELSAA